MWYLPELCAACVKSSITLTAQIFEVPGSSLLRVPLWEATVPQGGIFVDNCCKDVFYCQE